LAAALGSDRAGFKLGVTQLAAGMLETGLDDLVQRGAKRRQRILGAGLAASLALSGVMGFTALQAVEARNEAERARGEAEGLVEYMIKDLKFKLEPVGRLDLLEGIGDKAVEYYDAQDIKALPDDSLMRQAAARQVLAQVHLDAGRMEEAQREIEASAALTREVLERNPDDTDAIFAHGQSEFWVGAYYWKQGKLAEMEKPWREYDRLAQILYKKDPTNFDWVKEAGYGRGNLAILARLFYTQEQTSHALVHYSDAIEYFEEAIRLKPKSKSARQALATNMSGKANILLALSDARTARGFYLDYLSLRRDLAKKYPNDLKILKDTYVGETDYYNGYFITLNEDNKKDITSALSQIYALTQHDNKNLTYKNDFFLAVSNLFESLNKDELSLRKRQVESLLIAIPKNSGIEIDFYKSMLRVMDLRINLLEGNETSARKALSEISDLYLSNDHTSTNDWKLLHSIYSYHKRIGFRSEAQKFAEIFLNKLNDRSDLNFPTIVYRKAQAYMTLGKCDAVIPLAENLKARGYLDSSNEDLLSCKTN